ncbi:hypothetical protein MO867_01655 [Microbulbifer sp. OS29]|uniref:Uncharacterized protein n=1 Tax=Microbulbifer okhotskensis TaxID=2926617 RepID=A0A9X2EL50_9GAMM|nr:hypothetical protein [Microbulbifer okhotskensis]MCO1333035.1 hypothetical protein [Microbulbifer okhotskensis]
MRGVIPAALLLTVNVLAIPASAFSDCDTGLTTQAGTAGEAQAKRPEERNPELMLKQAMREKENDLLQRQMRHLEKLQQQAERNAVRTEKLQEIKDRS